MIQFKPSNKCFFKSYFQIHFLPNRPTGPIWSSSCNVRVFVCCPLPMQFSQGSKAGLHHCISNLKNVHQEMYIITEKISSNLYRASVCDMKKWTFLLVSLSQILYYTLQTSWCGMTKNILDKLPDHLWLQINTFNFEGCHTLTQIFQILIIFTFSTQLMANVITVG